jgi:hypothetical protein
MASLFGFGINIDENTLTASSDSDCNEKTTINVKLAPSDTIIAKRSKQNSRFQALKEKRKIIKEKNERKAAKKLQTNYKSNHTLLEEQSSVPSTSAAIVSTDLKFDEDLANKNIDKALAQNDFNRAEILSDQLADKQHETRVNTMIEAARFQAEIDRKKLIKSNKRSISWRFEAKKRWETKSNM